MITNYAEIMAHYGHKLEVANYADRNASIECVDCSQVLIDYDKVETSECNCEGDCLATRECTYCEGVADLLWFDDNGQWYVCVDCVKEGKLDSKGEGQ